MRRIVIHGARTRTPSGRRLARLGGAIGLLCCATFWPAWAQQGPQSLPSIQLGAGMHLIKAEVARTAQQHQIGLMHRQSMGLNEGMLFIFEKPAQQCFWMKNTLIPLAIAFVADDGTVVNVDEMQPQTLESHCSSKPVRHVLEMNAGWFTKRGIKAGSKLSGAPFASAK